MADVFERLPETIGERVPESNRSILSIPEANVLLNKSILSMSDADALRNFANDLPGQLMHRERELSNEVARILYQTAGSVRDISNDPSVQASVMRSFDPTVRLTGSRIDGTLNFETNNNLYASPLQEIAARNRTVAASSLDIADAVGPRGAEGRNNPADRFAELTRPLAGADAARRPGDNNVREVDQRRDSPQAVQQRYEQMVDRLGLPAEEAARMKAQFAQDMTEIQKKFQGDNLAHIMRSMNLMMDNNNHLGNVENRVNAVAGLAARGAHPQEANCQGANPTCALTSQSRIEQQRDFVRYADQMGSVAATGGAWRGGQNGRQPVWVNVDAAGTNHANFHADGEAGRMYNPAYHQGAGHRDYLGQLQDAVVGGEMAHCAGAREGRNYVYVAANAHIAGGDGALSQGGSGGGLFTRGSDGRLAQCTDARGNAIEGPPSTPDNVAAVNHANGGGGIFVHENMANQFRRSDGSYPPGMNVFRDAADLRNQLAANPGREYQILTNGVLVAGRAGHGLHAQEVSLQNGELVLGNNWGAEHNNRRVNDNDMNRYTDPRQWNDYIPQHTNPDGSPDWRRETIGPKTRNIVSNDNNNNSGNDNQDARKKSALTKAIEDEELLAKKEKERQRLQRRANLLHEHQLWQQRQTEAAYRGQTFSEADPISLGLD